MLNLKSLTLSFLGALLSVWGYAQTNGKDDYVVEPVLQYVDMVYQKNIKTVQLHEETNELSPAVLRLNSSEHLLLEFDDLEGDFVNYSYTILHCNADWKPSTLSTSEYLQGFNTESIFDYQYSLNTLQPYTHYSAIIPNSNSRLLMSGNYLLLVFKNNNQDEIVLTRRFMVYDERVQINAQVQASSNVEFRRQQQQVNLVLNYKAYPMTNPQRDLRVVILQNDQWSNAVYDIKPLFVNEFEMDFKLNQDAVFDGLSEFRVIDFRNLRFKNNRLDSIRIRDDGNHVYMVKEDKKVSQFYVSNQDINGKYIIRSRELNNAPREGDYAWVYFKLPFKQELLGGNVYVFGQLSDWQCLPAFKLTYNPETMEYTGKAFLKQGYYDFLYAFLKDKTTQPDFLLTEGNHSETENNYTILVYHRLPGRNADQLVGFYKTNSVRIIRD